MGGSDGKQAGAQYKIDCERCVGMAGIASERIEMGFQIGLDESGMPNS